MKKIFHTFPCFGKWSESWLPILLFQAVWNFQSGLRCFEQIQLAVKLGRSLNWQREMRFGKSVLYSSKQGNNNDSLSIPHCSTVRLNAITSRSEKRGATLLRSKIPRPVTRFLKISCIICQEFLRKLHLSCA